MLFQHVQQLGSKNLLPPKAQSRADISETNLLPCKVPPSPCQKTAVLWEISESETVTSGILKRPIHLNSLNGLYCEIMVCKTRQGAGIKAAP